MTNRMKCLIATPIIALAIAACQAPCPNPSTIGGTPVPTGLRCEEDEVIAFTGVDTLGCVHIENLP